MYIYRQPTLTMQWNFTIFAQILYSYFRYTGRLFLGCAFLLLAVIIRTSWETKKERMSYRKKYIEEFVWGTLLFWLCTLLSMSFCCFLCIYSLPLPKWHPCRMTPIKIYILLCVVFCVMISWVNGRKYENLLQFTTTCFFYKQCFFSTHPQLSVA